MDINATVLDASAILAFVNQEAGYETVERCLQGEAHCSAANWSEVKQKIVGSRSGFNWLETWLEIESLLVEYHGLIIESVSREDAERAAERWEVNKSLSLADRLCLALGDRLGLPAVTADQAWGDGDMIIQIR
ncbi:MAG: type II toxin-antitoxin system VapC family toxin [Synechococcus sp. SB0662_bin_45]|nr:type II toxin-antitoxin system VapC family toxin [Synechococcus sp. SB0668_bin_13]MYE21796.1 type II toxin-antitoxin system VapC family toxin [Synechococcus sp. SB0662_bin_45]